MKHWHVIVRADRMGGMDREMLTAYDTSSKAQEARDAMQQSSNVHGAGQKYAVRSCDKRTCG